MKLQFQCSCGAVSLWKNLNKKGEELEEFLSAFPLNIMNQHYRVRSGQIVHGYVILAEDVIFIHGSRFLDIDSLSDHPFPFIYTVSVGIK